MKLKFALCMVFATIAWVAANDETFEDLIPMFQPDTADLDFEVNESARIIGGQAVNITNYPHQCSIRVSRRRHICGCSILSTDYVLTAAHCVASTPPGWLTIVTGSSFLTSDGTSHAVDVIKVYSAYRFPFYDIAVVKVSNKIDLTTSTRKAVVLPAPREVMLNNASLYVSGWGRMANYAQMLPNRLHATMMNYVATKPCRIEWKTNRISINMLCAKQTRTGICKGDSGGALGIILKGNRFVQFGIASFVSSSGCTALPAVFTNVASYVPWILDKAGLC